MCVARIFVAAAVSMGTVLEVTKGLEVLTNYMFAWMQPFMTNIFSTTIVMYWTAFVYHFLLASEISMLGTSMPLVMEFAKSHDINPLLLGMIWTFAAGGKLFAYQSIRSSDRRVSVRIFRGARLFEWAHVSPS